MKTGFLLSNILVIQKFSESILKYIFTRKFLVFIASLGIIQAYTEKERTCKNMICYQLYEPICAINQDKQKSDFANRCFMEIANCPLHGNKSISSQSIFHYNIFLFFLKRVQIPS